MAGYSVTYSVVDNATKQIEQINRRITAMRAPMERMSRQVSRFVDVSGLRKVADGFQWIERAAGGVFRSLSAIVPVLGAITSAATVAGMVKLVGSFAAWGNALQTSADQIGISAQELQKYQDATTRAGGSAADMTETLKNLHTISAQAFTGMNAEAYSFFKRFNIDLPDANGHLKTSTQLLREVFKALDGLPSSYDRSKVAATLLGDAQAKLYEEYKQSGQPLDYWLGLEAKHAQITDQQLDAQNRYRLAQASLGLSFEQLGRQVSAVLANNFTPLIQNLDEFVQKHSPEITAAVDHISKQFAQWLENVNWAKVQQGAEELLHGLETVAKNLDTVLHVVELVAAAFAAKWAIGIVSDIATVGKALGEAGVGGSGGSGLLGKLAMAGNLATLAFSAWQKAQNPATYDPKNLATDSPFWHGIPKEEQLKYPQSPESKRAAEAAGTQPPGTVQGSGAPTSFVEHPGTWLADRLLRGGHPAAPAAPLGLAAPAAGQAPQQLPQLPGDTSWGDYGTRANNPGNMNYARWQNAAGRYSYMDQTEGRQHTMAVYNTMEEGVSDAYKLMARKQDEHGKTIAGALSGWSTTAGYDKTIAGMAGMDPNAPFDVSSADPAMVERLMQAQFKMEGRRGSHSATEAQILGGINLARQPADTQIAQAPPAAVAQAPPAAAAPAVVAQAPPAAPPPGPAPLNGAVTVDITHRNAPPDATVTARGSGSVNVDPVRIEHPQVDFTAA
jgi:hypothetical protein